MTYHTHCEHSTNLHLHGNSLGICNSLNLSVLYPSSILSFSLLHKDSLSLPLCLSLSLSPFLSLFLSLPISLSPHFSLSLFFFLPISLSLSLSLFIPIPIALSPYFSLSLLLSLPITPPSSLSCAHDLVNIVHVMCINKSSRLYLMRRFESLKEYSITGAGLHHTKHPPTFQKCIIIC